MPMINIKFDDTQVKKDEILSLSNAVRDMVAKATEIKDVFVYADSPDIKVQVAPIEIFIEMGVKEFEKINRNTLIKEIKTKLQVWKKEVDFNHSINITLTPVDWDFEIGI